MLEFLGEGAGSFERRGMPRRPVGRTPGGRLRPVRKPAFPKIRGRKRPRRGRETELADFLRDFRMGLARLGRAAEKFKRRLPGRKLRPPVPVGPRRKEPSLARILEREIRTVTKYARQAPDVRHTAVVTREFRRRAERVVEQHLPQIYVAILRAERKVAGSAPTGVALPMKQRTSVESLVKAARAIRAGRLPFLPRETRARAQQLLETIFGRTGAAAAMRSRGPDTRRLIDRRRLIPLAVKSEILRELHERAVVGKPGESVDPVAGPAPRSSLNRQLLGAINDVLGERIEDRERETVREVPSPLSDGEIRRLDQAVPSFAAQGVVTGSPYLAHAGEDVHVITRQDRPLIEPHERAVPEVPRLRPEGIVQSRIGASPATAGGGGVAAPGFPELPGRAAGPAAGVTEAVTTGPARIEGTLKIPGLSDWIAKIEGEMRS